MDNLQIGVFGWQYSSWLGKYYPEDLPEEWMLDYYSNAYRVVLVPEQAWLSWNDEQIEETLDSVEAPFYFYLQVLESVDEIKQQQLLKIKAVFAEALSGLVVFSEEQKIEPEYCNVPVTLVSKANVLPGWNWSLTHGDNEYVCSGAVCGLVFDMTNDAKKQTALLQDFVASLPESSAGAPLVVYTNKEDANAEIDMTQVYNLKTIGEFLGY